MPHHFISPLVTAAELNRLLDDPQTVVLDSTWVMPNDTRSPTAEYRLAHIRGARFFDIDAIADRSVDLPHMLPTPEAFAAAVGALGIGNDSEIIVYDNNGFLASARVWWMFRVFGHDRVRVLDGGLNAWLQSGGGVCSELPAIISQAFTPFFHPELVTDYEAMRELTASGAVEILDARPPGRFHGTTPEPRAGLRSGHMPGSLNWFYQSVLDLETMRLKTPEALAQALAETGAQAGKPIVTTCGSGVTAAILALALYRLGYADVAVYDGSWSEWGGRDDAAVVTG